MYLYMCVYVYTDVYYTHIESYHVLVLILQNLLKRFILNSRFLDEHTSPMNILVQCF